MVGQEYKVIRGWIVQNFDKPNEVVEDSDADYNDDSDVDQDSMFEGRGFVRSKKVKKTTGKQMKI